MEFKKCPMNENVSCTVAAAAPTRKDSILLAECFSVDEISGALARGYCAEKNTNKVLDPDLIEAMKNEVMCLPCGYCKEYYTRAEGWVSDDRNCGNCGNGEDCAIKTWCIKKTIDYKYTQWKPKGEI